VKGLSVTCDQRIALFNASKHLYTMKFEDIFAKSKEKQEKLKVGWTQLPASS
jgi:hypothetical protein